MASQSSFNFLVFFCLLFPIIISTSIAKTSSSSSSFRPKTLYVPVTKVVHSPKNQYVIHTKQRTPLVPIKQALDLGGEYTWSVCGRSYVSSTYKPARCGSAKCSLAKSSRGCNINSTLCIVNTFNRVGDHIPISGVLGQDTVSVGAFNGSINPGKPVSVPDFLFVCGKSPQYLQGLAGGVKGIVGLGRSKLGLPSQFASAFSLKRKFAMCLSSSTTSNGVVFFGDGPYYNLARLDLSQALVYTPLVAQKSSEYYVGVESIKINDKEAVHFNNNTRLLSISTVEPYTVLHTAIYEAVVGEFESALIGDERFKRVEAVKPFGSCYNSSYIGIDRLGPVVPRIEVVLRSQSVPWTIYGGNAMVNVGNQVLCLGLVDGGREIPLHQPSLIIGGHQLENNFLQFDLAGNRLGFSSSLFARQTTCSDFIF